MSRSIRPTVQFGCASCGRSLAVPRLMAGGLTRCPHCRRWMFAPHAGVSTRDLDRAQAGVDTVVDGLQPITRTPPPPPKGVDHAAREAVALLSSALALQAAGRLPDAVTVAERANHQLADAVRTATAYLTDLRTALNGLQPATARL